MGDFAESGGIGQRGYVKEEVRMDVYKINDVGELIKDNEYVGRGIIIGKSKDGKKAVCAYFIMGRSVNSRNRVFVKVGDEVIIHPFDAEKAGDPSLIIYSPVKSYGNNLIVTNGNQTDTVYEFIRDAKTFEQALDTRCFEPDKPNFTPRISGLITFDDGDFNYRMNILKSGDSEGTVCNRYNFSYVPIKGLGHFIHTYVTNGDPIPTFVGEPERVAIEDDIETFTDKIWDNLNKDNKISLYVRYTDLASGEYTDKLINKNV